MRACFYIGPSRDDWCWKFFPGKSPGELPIAGKSWCCHAVDFCSLLAVTDIYVADCFFNKELPYRLGDGSFWSLHLHYMSGFPCAGLDDLLRLHRETIPSGDDLLVFWGQVLPDVADPHRLLEELRPVDPSPDVLPSGIYLLRGGRLYECVCPLFRQDSLNEYFALNFRLQRDPGIYNLPGYSGGNGCRIGKDVVIMLGCELEEPVVIHDNVRLERGVHLHNGVIVGSDVLVDEHSELDHSIILNHTYIGKYMYLRNKIVDGSRVIDVEYGSMVELEDGFLTGSMRRDVIDGVRMSEYLIALCLVVVLMPLWFLTLLFRGVLTRMAFFNFLSRIYPKCCKVLWGGASLVRCGWNDSDYAFRCSDMWPLHQDMHHKNMDDIYFYYHRSVHMVAAVVVLSLLKRFFMMAPPDCEHDEEREREVGR